MLEKRNYILLITSFLIVLTGFFLMAESGNHSQHHWEEKIMSFRTMILAPITVLAGYGMVFFSILHLKKQ
ncbi:MAG: hypothetical protein CL843_11445 [Crocinitomicaceae bacterium]|nr:hypothetical protein [Crocinitomicaceae bacterium]